MNVHKCVYIETMETLDGNKQENKKSWFSEYLSKVLIYTETHATKIC